MGARAIWKGSLKVGSTSIPVKLYAAIHEHDIRFHILQGATKSRVKQKIVTEEHRAVEKEDIRKGYEIEPGRFVIVEPKEIEQLKPKESRIVSFPRFVPISELPNEWYERPYYVGPDGDTQNYFALAEALDKRRELGIARWSMRGKSYVGALRVHDEYLTLIKLRYAEEVRSLSELEAPVGRQLDQKELHMAEQLVQALEGDFKPEEFRDEYRDRLAEFIEAKAKGKRPRLPKIAARRTRGSLEQQLAKSLAAMKRGKGKKVA
jgi:DNA end-binding protein Ku